MFFRKTATLFIILLLSTFSIAQTALQKEATEKSDKLRTDAVAFLRETLADVNGMRSIENRISFTAELAALMWFHDEREARSMYIGAIAQFKDLIGRYESRMNELGPPDEDEEPGARLMPFLLDPSDRIKVLRKFAVAMGVRQQLALSMAEHDPELAFSFYYDSLSIVANPALRQEMDSKESGFETRLLGQLAEKNPDKAAKFGKKAIEDGVNLEHYQLLKKIYAKDAEQGREFGLAILASVKNGGFDGLYIISGLIEFGEGTLADSKKPNGKRTVYTELELRELAEVMAQSLLGQSNENAFEGQGYIATIQKYLPGRAAQLRAKFKVGRKATNSNTNAAYSEVIVDAGEDFDGAIVTSSANTDAASRRREEREKAEKQLLEDVQSMSTKQLPKDERDKIVAQARKIISTTPGRDKKITALSMLAAQVAKLGDKELASEIMRDAERLVSPAPKNFQDFMLSWMLASGYASADPDKAFPILEETIGRANETLAAFFKIGEFIDVNEDYITDGEVQVGAFGGQMVQGLTKELNVADSTIDVLAKADFAKTKILTNRFDRAEVRVLAKMMVLRAVLSPKTVVDPTKETALK